MARGWFYEGWLQVVKSVKPFATRVAIPGNRLFPLPVDFSFLKEVEWPGTVFPRAACEQAWVELVSLGLNLLHGEEGPFPTARRTRAVQKCKAELENRVHRFFNQPNSPGSSMEDIWDNVKNKHINYEGEEVSIAKPLTLAQIQSAMPPVGHGGSVELAPLLTGRSRFLLEHPEELLLPQDQKPPGPNTAKVHIKKGDEPAIFNLLRDRGVIDWVPSEQVYRDEGGLYLSGLFGVPKPHRFTKDHQEVLRLIMNLIPINRALGIICGDIDFPPSSASWQLLALDQEECVRVSQCDMSSAFYLFRLPPCWLPYLCFHHPMEGASVGMPEHAVVYPACRVLPMGWSSSVGLMQQASRELIRRVNLPSGEELHRQGLVPRWFVQVLQRETKTQTWWQVYLDNFMAAEVGKPEHLSEKTSQFHAAAVGAWDAAGVLCSEDKHVLEAPVATELGIQIHGPDGLVGASGVRLAQVVWATLALQTKLRPHAKHLQVILGRWIFALQFRRPAMSVLSQSWLYITKPNLRWRLWPIVCKELSVLILLAPLLQADLRLRHSPLVTCSDASETGGAVASSNVLTPMGAELSHRLSSPQLDPVDAEVLVISAFNGIGGAFRGYDLQGVRPAHLIAIELDDAARRTTRTCWPRVLEVCDVSSVTLAMIKQWANQFPRVKAVHVWGGFPCVHLSSARAGRQNLQGPGSNLFFTLVQIIKWVEQIFTPWAAVEFVVENVASMDVSARDEISARLQIMPLRLDPANCTPISRPRYAWISKPVTATVGTVLIPRDGYVQVEMTAEFPSAEHWLEPGWSLNDPEVKFATFMKSIPRWKPPSVPAGLHRCDARTVERWRSDEFRFPPYQYKQRNLVIDAQGNLRYLSPLERERLMGMGAGATEFCFSASRIKHHKTEYIDKRLSLLGDGFAMISFGWIAGQLVAQWSRPRTPQEIVDRLGLATGASAAPQIAVPLSQSLGYGGDPAKGDPSMLVAQISRAVFAGHTRRERRAARAGINLYDSSITFRTRQRYHTGVRALLPFLEHLQTLEEVEAAAEEWVELQWATGSTLGLIGDALCGLQFYWPGIKPVPKPAWRLFKNWRRLEVPMRAPPIPADIVRAFVSYLLDRSEVAAAFLIALGFHAYLRTGELMALQFRDLQVNEVAGVVSIRGGKTGRRLNVCEAVAIYDPVVRQLAMLALLLPHNHHGLCRIWPGSPQSFRALFARCNHHFQLAHLQLKPYSLRRGGATHDFIELGILEPILLRGRWRSLAVARLYIEDGLAQIPALALPPATAALVRRCASVCSSLFVNTRCV
eukprot:Skav230039  [mRNA]  locus=scaffold465:66745:71032:+ [translate_table: standard]